jgi:hypothetical protein
MQWNPKSALTFKKSVVIATGPYTIRMFLFFVSLAINTDYFLLNSINRLFRIIDAECVLCNVETEGLYIYYLLDFDPGLVYVKFMMAE